MLFDISISELLFVSLCFVTSISCALTYFCCTKSLKILEMENSISKAVNKLRVLDQYVLSKVNLIVGLIYFGLSFLFIKDLNITHNYIFFFACLLSFGMNIVTTFVSRLCYCYTCNLLMETKLNELECLIFNFKNLVSVYLPFVVISAVIPSVYLINISLIYKHIICFASLAIILIIWVLITPKIMVLNYNAKKIEENSLLKHRLENLLEAHDIKRYKLYSWDTSKSKESNAIVSGIRTYHLFISSSLLEVLTLPELETVITHEIGHIKNKHLLKMTIGKIFMIMILVLTVLSPYILHVNFISQVLLHLLAIAFGCVGVLISVGIERNYETQADAYAVTYNDPELFISVLEKVTKYEDEAVNKADELFQSHPGSKERIDNIKKED